MTTQIGTNVDLYKFVAVPDLAEAGATWVRCVCRPDVDARNFIGWCADYAIRVLLVLGAETFAERPWEEVLRELAEQYDPNGYYQVGNESDKEGPSSWTMEQSDLTRLVKLTREYLPWATLVGPGLASGDPSWLDHVDLTPLDAIAVHPYTIQPEPTWPAEDGGNGTIEQVVQKYARHGKPTWLTEYGVESGDSPEGDRYQGEYISRMTVAIRQQPNVPVACQFCWSDAMVPTLGLLREDGSKKPAYLQFQAATRTV